MRAICVDDERLLLEDIVGMCRGLSQIDEACGFTSAAEALAWAEENQAELAILDIDMPVMNGMELAIRLKELQPSIAILFLTGYAEFAVDAIANHIDASGYLLKPVGKERLAKEVDDILAGMNQTLHGDILVKTFGEFDLRIGGHPVLFERSKAKELLAYLVDRQGAGITRERIFSVLWEDRGDYNRQAQKYLDVIIRSLRSTLKAHGAEQIIAMEKGVLRACPENFDCDLYRFFDGDPAAINAYCGEYMSEYPWASMVEAYMDRMKRGGK